MRKNIGLDPVEQAEAQQAAHVLTYRLGPSKASEKLAVNKSTLLRWRTGESVPGRVQFVKLRRIAQCLGR